MNYILQDFFKFSHFLREGTRCVKFLEFDEIA